MSSSSWLTSLTCSSPVIQSTDSFMSVIEWVRFIFLSPCPQRIVFSAVNVVFLFTLLVVAIQKLCSRFSSNVDSDSSIRKPLLEERKPRFKTTLWFTLSIVVTSLWAIACTIFCLLVFIQGTQTSWEVEEGIFRLIQAKTQVGIVILLVHEMKLKAVAHPLSLRIYWVANFVLVCAFAVSSVSRFLLASDSRVDSSLRVDDILYLCEFPLSVFLLVVAMRGTTGIREVSDSGSELHEKALEANVSKYASASFFSKLVWLWMTPMINKGYKSPLNLEDVPILPRNFRAKNMSELFASNWPSPAENSGHPVRTTLIRCFWKELAFTGFLCVIRLGVMYAGPVLVDSFVAFTSGQGSSPYEGYLLVFVLLIAKTIEVLSSHHFNFQTIQLGMLIRSSLISTLFRKGLRLSCSSRQAHGAGQIVNYMAVDVQQLGDTVQYVHSIWLMPMQVGVALLLLYGSLGIASLVALAGVIVVLVLIIWRTRLNNRYQFQIMRNRDSRIKATMEMINNMRVIKLQAWEDFFGDRVGSFRKLEFGWVGKFLYSMSLNLVVLWNTPITLAVVVFAVAVATGIRLDAGTAFTATTTFKVLQEPIRNFPQSLTQISQAMIALDRLDRYMRTRELDQGSIEREEGCSSDIAVDVIDGSFSWDDEADEKVLSDLNLEIKKGEFAAIVGTVGAGKSSLLSSILGEMHKISGKVRVCGSTAYVAQSSWIQNGTIEENILFGLPMNRERYMETIRVCSLERDFEIMEFGDKTEIGERGINLSGGQKQRIQLARAVYQDCDIYLLDDVFSAVDAQTASDLFKECVRGALRHKTVLLVTHQVDFLHNADLILVMRDGRIVQSGKYEDMLEAGMDFGALVAAHETSMEIVGMSNSTSEKRHTGTPKSNKPSIEAETIVNGDEKLVDESMTDKGTSKLIEDEEKETGRVSWKVYKNYFTKYYGWWGVVSFTIISLFWQLSAMSSDLWLAYETSEDREFIPNVFISVYAILAAVSCIVVLIRAFYLTFLGLKTSQSFFEQMLNSILRAPMTFFDTTPSGRILSRASTDQVNLDILIPMFLGMVLIMYFSVLGIIVITCVYSWPTTFLVLPLIWVNMWYRGYYIATSRELTRLDSITKAPIIHHFSETISGITTIRCFRKQGSFIQENINKVDANLRMVFYNNGSNEWLGFRLEFIGCLFLCLSTMFMVTLPSSIIKPEYVGMSLSYGLSLNVVLFYSIYMTCTVENRMVSVERIEQFINIPSEAEWKIPNCLPSPNWPTHGNIELQDLKVRYRSNTPLVLKGMTLCINGGEKIGIVGRTGSGKSTLIQVFFRLVEPSAGKIIVDGVDICKLGLHDLRSRFGIIPQEPVLFQGTVRSNIDPIGLYSDEEIWMTLDRCQLRDVVASKPGKLDSSVTDSGENWSMGQRQLLCLGRVLLKQTRILFLDEATASVDSQTDAIIQKIIREDFSTCTIVSIAHRIPTIMDCDRVLVVDDGRAREFDKPSHLLERPSIFASLVQEYANRSTG